MKMIQPISSTSPEQIPEITASSKPANDKPRSDEFRAAIAALALGLTGPETPDILEVDPSSFTSSDLEIEVEEQPQFQDNYGVDESDHTRLSIVASQVSNGGASDLKTSKEDVRSSELPAKSRDGESSETQSAQPVSNAQIGAEESNSAESTQVEQSPQIASTLVAENPDVGQSDGQVTVTEVADQELAPEQLQLADRKNSHIAKSLNAAIAETSQGSTSSNAGSESAEVNKIKESVIEIIKNALSEGVNKDTQAAKASESSNGASLFSASLVKGATEFENPSQQSSLTGILIRQAIDTVRFNLKGGVDANAGIKQDLTRVAAGTDINTNHSVREKNPRLEQLPKPLAQKTLLRVEQVLKEAALSKDKKTISFRLDPPQLGQVKVDVSIKNGELTARLSAENKVVSHLLWEQAPELQRILRKLGLNVDRVQVAVSQFSNGELRDASDGQSGGRNRQGQAASKLNGGLEGGSLEQSAKQEQVLPEDHWVA